MKTIVLTVFLLAAALNSYSQTSGTGPGNPESSIQFLNTPNPFSETTTIKFFLKEDSNVILYVTNILTGKTIDMVDGLLSAGEHGIVFKAPKDEAGEYNCTFRAYSPSSKSMLHSTNLIMIKQ